MGVEKKIGFFYLFFNNTPSLFAGQIFNRPDHKA
jgi:hypothetical protein